MSNIGSGNKGKFSDRLKKMRRDRLKKKILQNNIIDINETEKVSGKIKKTVLLPFVFVSMAFEKKELSASSKSSNENIKTEEIKQIDVMTLSKKKKYKVVSIKSYKPTVKENTSNVKIEDSYNSLFKKVDNEKLDVNDAGREKAETLEKTILALIKKRLVKNINELEILCSELYLISEIDSNDIYFKRCQNNINEIRKILIKIRELKEKYDYLKDNFDFEYLLELNDDFLPDKIIELKKMCSEDDIITFVEDYKMLDEFKYLYLKIDKLREDSICFEDYKLQKVEELKSRDIDFEKFKEQVFDVSKVNDTYSKFITDENDFLNGLEGKISKIDSYESVSYRLRGFNELIGATFRYFGMLMVHPLRGLLPGIVAETVVARNMVSNLTKNLNIEENKKMVYLAEDFSSQLNTALNNLDYANNMVDSSLDDISSLKREFDNKFKKYSDEIPEYKLIMKKLNRAENTIMANKIKLDEVRGRLKIKEQQNGKKLILVKKLNK